MSHDPHQLLEEFPDKAEKILRLRMSDTKFAQMFTEYHILNHEIVEAEANVRPMSDEVLETLKKKRLKMLDQFSTLLQ